MENRLPKLDLNITNRCNLRCAHCAFNSGVRKIDELSPDKIKKILQDTKELGGRRIDITGGEATLRTYLEEIISAGKSLDYRIELITNGSTLSQERLQRLKRLGLDSLAVSLEGATYNTHARIRKVNESMYQHTLQTIQQALSLGFYTKINTTVFESNLEELPALTEWCIKEKVHEHGFYYFTPVGRGNYSQERSVEPIRWLSFIREKLKPYSSSPIKISLEVPFIEKEFWKEKYSCTALGRGNHVQILPNGEAYSCAILASYHVSIADLSKLSIKEIWDNSQIWKNYQSFVNRVLLDKNSYCVDFKNNFNLRDYSDKYAPVCPLYKFELKEFP